MIALVHIQLQKTHHHLQRQFQVRLLVQVNNNNII